MGSGKYRHTQIGWVVLVSVGAAIVLISYLLMEIELHWIGLAVLALLGVCLVLFSTLTVVGNEHELEVRFGPGLIRKKFSLENIESCREVKNSWYYGWGIRLTPRGWLFNVSGFRALEIQMRTGKRFRIGTNDPRGLSEFVRAQIARSD